MLRSRPKNLSLIRHCQRSHAKKRFEQRFALNMNRDRLYEIEKKIASGQTVQIERRPQISNYFVAIEGKLVAVGYNKLTKRVVTALPDDYVARLPPGLVHFARLRLLNDETGVISDILSCRYCQLLYRQDASVSYYMLHYPGFSFKTGYDCRANRLVPYVRQRTCDRPQKLPPGERFGVLDLDLDICKQIRQKIQSGESRFIWRYSDTVKFHEVEIGTQTLRIGYSNASDKLYRYEDPSEDDLRIKAF